MRSLGPLRAVLLTYLIAPAAVAVPRLAQAQTASASVAEALYQEGKKLFDAGKTHEACLKFQGSQDADPALGTLIHLAVCNEKDKHLATAWSEYNDAISLAQKAGEKDREKFARAHAAALEPKLHRVVVTMTTQPTGLAVQLDGAPFPVRAFDVAIPIDQGEHTFIATATGKKEATVKITIDGSANTDPIRIPDLADDPAAIAALNPPPVVAAPAPAKPLVEEHPDATKRNVGLVVGGIGLAGLVVGIAEELHASSKDSDSKKATTQADANTLHSQAISAQTDAFLIGGIGIAALAVGTVLVLTSGGSSASTAATTGAHLVPTASSHGANLSLVGSF